MQAAVPLIGVALAAATIGYLVPVLIAWSLCRKAMRKGSPFVATVESARSRFHVHVHPAPPDGMVPPHSDAAIEPSTHGPAKSESDAECEPE